MRPIILRGASLKHKLQSNLHAPGRQATADGPRGRRPNDSVRIVEVGVVEGIEQLPSGLQPHTLLDYKFAVNSGIQIAKPWPKDNSVPRVPKRKLPRNPECGNVEP